MKALTGFTLGLLLIQFGSAAATRHVSLNNPSPASPYTSWSTAATNIQDALDVASPGDQILVSNGVYQVGSRITADGTTNRIAVTKPVSVIGVNGSLFTLINGGGIMRCVFLTNGASLSGFTLTNGNAINGGGVYCSSTSAVVSDSLLTRNNALSGGGAYSGFLTNCTLSANRCPFGGGNGGGATGAVLISCTLTGNETGGNSTGSSSGGGASGCVLFNCTLSGNKSLGAGAGGGGAYNSVLNNCTISGSRADYGPGGAYNCTLTNCTVSGNISSFRAGGISGGVAVNCLISNNASGGVSDTVLYNCTISGNSIGAGSCTLNNCLIVNNTGVGVGGSTLNNCTVSGNTGGGVSGSVVNNCIVYYNSGGSGFSNVYNCTLRNSCTTDGTGSGVITNEPLFVASGNSYYHLQPGSPCINAGTNFHALGNFDLGGNLRIAGGTVDMGAHEFQTVGALAVSLLANLTNVVVGYPVNLSGVFSKGQSNYWDFADGTVASNQLSVTHTWTSPGSYPVVLTAYDVGAPGGVSASLMIHVKTQIVYYVNAAGTNPAVNPLSPYDSWNTAATNIQDAIDAALPVPQSLVLVSNGVYQFGGRPVIGLLTNRVAINKRITVRSLNGPAVTIVRGNPIIGDSAVSCAYVTNGAVLSGFTLCDGATRSSGNTTREQTGGGVWCESAAATVQNCIISNNAAVLSGGGVYGGTVLDCLIRSNRVVFTPGIGNSYDPGNGGGAMSANLIRCTIRDNLAANYGGGVSTCQVTNCVLTGNRAFNGGGASFGTLVNSSLSGNAATWEGGGVFNATLNNCTVIANSAGQRGGGVKYCTVRNSIIYYNQSAIEPNFSGYSPSGLNYSCSYPMPEGGVGNIIAEPLLTDLAHLSAASPCRAVGSSDFVSGVDFDTETWLTPPSMGCDEFNGAPAVGNLSVAISAAYSNVATGFAMEFSAKIFGHASQHVWDFGDGARSTNQLVTAHTWAAPGTYAVVLTAHNADHSSGVSATQVVQVVTEPVHYVALNGASPVAPYLSWATAATNLQDAVDAAFGGGTVLASNGVYQTGGRLAQGGLTNRLVVSKAITVRGLNGPAVTVIRGYQMPGVTNGDAAIRCLYLSGRCLVSGFTLAGGATRDAGIVIPDRSGGGVYSETSDSVVSNCVISANSAMEYGGGVFRGTFADCIFSSNRSLGYGGGACEAILNYCVLSNNVAVGNGGGGAQWCSLTNCTVVDNRSYYSAGLGYCTAYDSTIRGNQGTTGAGAIGGTLTRCILEFNSANWGGGAYSATLINCLVRSNVAATFGGGVVSCDLLNCTLIGNTAGSGGGAHSSALKNCVSFFNSAGTNANYSSSTLNFSCSTPLPPVGVGNLTNSPLFVDLAGGNFRLSPNSPCINAGSNGNAPVEPDLDSQMRIVGGTVDIGAFEFPNPTSLLSYAWAQQYGLPTDGSADLLDFDGDGMKNYREWRSDTNPTNSLSVLRMLNVANGPAGADVAWQSVSTRNYWLERAADLGLATPFEVIATNIIGEAGLKTFTDTSATNAGPYFFRVGVH